MSGLRITIDPVACEAYGYCAELLPEAISLDEWGYPIVDNRPLHARARGPGQAGGTGLPEASYHVAGEGERLAIDPCPAAAAFGRRQLGDWRNIPLTVRRRWSISHHLKGLRSAGIV